MPYAFDAELVPSRRVGIVSDVVSMKRSGLEYCSCAGCALIAVATVSTLNDPACWFATCSTTGISFWQ